MPQTPVKAVAPRAPRWAAKIPDLKLNGQHNFQHRQWKSNGAWMWNRSRQPRHHNKKNPWYFNIGCSYNCMANNPK